MSEVKRYTASKNNISKHVKGRAIGTTDFVMVMASDYDAAMSREAALREELAKANEKIDKAWNQSTALDHQGFIPGALDAWKRPVKQHLPCDFSGNPGASAIQYCNGWNDSGGYWSAHAKALQQRLTDAEKLLCGWYAANAAGGIMVADEDYHLVTATAEMLEQVSQKEGEGS